MKIRVISDIHYDVNNHRSGREMRFGERDAADLTIIAGDIAGSMEETKKFLHKVFPDEKVVFIGGNHIVYNNEQLSLQDLFCQYQHEFPKDFGSWHFLQNDYVEFGDAVIWGSVFYTNYKYWQAAQQPPEQEIFDYNMAMAERGLNDFRYGHYFDLNLKKLRPLRPKDYLMEHEKAFSSLNAFYEKLKNSGKKLIVVTHHPMSPKIIKSPYVHNEINASYCSDYDWWFNSKPEIKLYCCGHVHSRFNLKIYDTWLICNPHGYGDESVVEPKFDFNKIINI